jgi:acetyltransferase-like isoleucine patch superfamily enzyme
MMLRPPPFQDPQTGCCISVNPLLPFIRELNDWVEAFLGAIPRRAGVGLRAAYYRLRFAESAPDLSIRAHVSLSCLNHICIGANVMIDSGEEWGHHAWPQCAGAVVTKKFPTYAIVGGVPARAIGTRRT